MSHMNQFLNNSDTHMPYINLDKFIDIIVLVFRHKIKFAPKTHLRADWLNASKCINVNNREEE